MEQASSPNHRKIILIKKASGDEQPFSADKLEQSLRNAGADLSVAKEIVTDIGAWVCSGVTTKKIYGRAFSLLRKKKLKAALRYKLKTAMLELGPTGYPFEQLVGQLFKKLGYDVEVAVVVRGTHVTHEMDVIATLKSHQHLMECKYSQDQGKQVSVQVPLYVRSRVDDIVAVRKDLPQYDGFAFTGWVVTNTRFSSDSIRYGEGSGLQMLAWDYPQGNGLKDLLERETIFPITVLGQLTAKDKQELINRGIVSCMQLKDSLHVLDMMDLAPAKRKTLARELEELCS